MIAQEQIGRDSVAFLERHGYQVVSISPGALVLHVGDSSARQGKS
jgi:hypothetical protein